MHPSFARFIDRGDEFQIALTTTKFIHMMQDLVFLGNLLLQNRVEPLPMGLPRPERTFKE